MKNSWHEYKQLLLSELEANRSFRKEVRETLGTVREDISGLKVKAAIAGGMAGLVGTGIMSFLINLWK